MNFHDLKRSCRPNAFLKPQFEHLCIHSVALVNLQEIPNGTEVTIPFDEDYQHSTNPLQCFEHRNSIDDCPLEQKRRQFQREPRYPIGPPYRIGCPNPTDGCPFRRSCHPNIFFRLVFLANGEFVGARVLGLTFVPPGNVLMIPFDADYKISPDELVCGIHHTDMSKCPKEIERRAMQNEVGNGPST